MIIIGIGGFLGHDSSATLLVDGEVVAAAQEERFSGKKHDKGFPHQAIRFCLEKGNVAFEEVTHLAFTEKPYTVRAFNRGGRFLSKFGQLGDHLLPIQWASSFHGTAFSLFPNAEGFGVEHHKTHISPSFLLSGFSEAAFLCVDGKGENYCATYGSVSKEGIEILGRHDFENGLGILYTIVTHFLGFLSFGDEYKVMGLAPYGKPIYVEEISNLFRTNDKGRLRLKTRHSWMRLDGNLEMENHLGFPMRKPEDPIEQKHKDVAASIQNIFEIEITKLAQLTRHLCGDLKGLIFTGGCAQNCVAAGKLSRSDLFDSVFASPLASDMSSSLGAATHLANTCGVSVDTDSFRSLQTGPTPGEAPVESKACRVDYEGPLHSFIAKELSGGKCVAWVRGQMELGPRALGARSILADPRDSGARDHLNRKIKFRESFRPFGPAILSERLSEWFDVRGNSAYMNLTARVLPEHTGDEPKIPAVVHVDSSSRIQAVDQKIHPDFHQLLEAFDEITGVPILINTSFNLASKPIVCSAEDAWESFVSTELDLLVIGDEVFEQP